MQHAGERSAVSGGCASRAGFCEIAGGGPRGSADACLGGDRAEGARARTGLIAVHWCVPAPSGSVMAKRAPFPWAALGLVLLAASVEGILDAAPHSALRPGLRRREPVAMGLASVPSPPVPREPLGFIAGFDFDAFGKGLKDFALGGISGGRASCVPVAVGRRGCCSAASRARRSTGPA